MAAKDTTHYNVINSIEPACANFYANVVAVFSYKLGAVRGCVINLMIFERIVIAFLFGMIILEQNYAKRSLFKMGNFKVVSRLGIYTYGLYCLHFLGLYFAIKAMNVLHLDGSRTWVSISMVVLALLISIMVSLMSYHFFEKWFLKWKDKFAFIVKK